MENKLLMALLLGQAAPPPVPPPMAPPPVGQPPMAPPPGVVLQPPVAPPPGVTVPPPPGQVPPAAGLPGEIPPDENAPKPRINIESSYPKVTMLKYVGIGFLMASASMAMILNHFLVNVGSAGEPLLNLVLGLGLLGAAILFGLIAFFNEDWRKWMSYFSTFAMIGGIAARPIVTPLVTYDFGTVLPAVIFAFTFFMFLEYLDAYQRFTDVARMAVERNLQSFNINQVINHFLTWGAMLAAGFMVSALVILTFVTQLFAGAMGEEIARSVEMQAVFGQALAITVIFTLVAVVLSFLFLFLDRRTEVEQVAYSREQIRDMVAKGGQPGAAGGPQGPAAPTTIFPPGKTAGFVQQK